MQIIKQKLENMSYIPPEDQLLIFIGQVAGECYGSSMDKDRCIRRALSCIKKGHHSPWEHFNFTMKVTTDRGTTHALVRHRHCAFQQSSTIYQKNKEVVLVDLPEVDPYSKEKVKSILDTECKLYEKIEELHTQELESLPAHRARDILPNSLAANLIITTNIREWMYIAFHRTGPGDAVRMHVFAEQLHAFLKEHMPLTYEAFAAYYSNGHCQCNKQDNPCHSNQNAGR